MVGWFKCSSLLKVSLVITSLLDCQITGLERKALDWSLIEGTLLESLRWTNKVMWSMTYLPCSATVPHPGYKFRHHYWQCGTERGLLCLTVWRGARFAVVDSGAQDEVCYSTHLPNLKSIASSIPEILKEFKICIQTDTGMMPCRYRYQDQNITCHGHVVAWQVISQLSIYWSVA